MYLKNDRILTALSIMLDVAFHVGRSGVVSGADIARRSGLLRRGIEPVLQALSRAGLLDSVRGPKGGYRLGKDNNPLQSLVVAPLWAELNDSVKERLAGITLADLLQKAERSGLERPRQAPISFTI